jgi:hypothetical protein
LAAFAAARAVLPRAFAEIGGEYGAKGVFQTSRTDWRMNARASSLAVRTVSSTCARCSSQSFGIRRRSFFAAHLVNPCVLLQTRCARWVEITRDDPATLLPRWDSEGPHTRESVADDIVGGERIDEFAVLHLKARVPVDEREVKGEGAVRFRLCRGVG